MNESSQKAQLISLDDDDLEKIEGGLVILVGSTSTVQAECQQIRGTYAEFLGLVGICYADW